jgi:hypothetical protein
MPQDNREIDLMRLLIAEIWFGISMKAARELYGRSYFSLGMIEKSALDQTVASLVATHYCALTTTLPQQPAASPSRQAGFQPESACKQLA